MDQGEAVLDSMNYSELVQTFHDSKFLENYTVEPSPDSTDVLVIIPKNYPDLVVSLMRYNNDIFLKAEVYMLVGAFGQQGTFYDIETKATEELVAIARHIGYEEIASNLYWDDNDFAAFPDFILIPMFFGQMAALFTYCVAMTARKGMVLEELLRYQFTDNNLSVAFFTFLGSGICFLYIWYIVGYGVPEILFEPICTMVLAVAVLFLACGLWLLFHGTPASVISVGELKKSGIWFATAGGILTLTALWFVVVSFTNYHDIAFCLIPGVVLFVFGLHLKLYRRKRK
jgi:hypothetical protein